MTKIRAVGHEYQRIISFITVCLAVFLLWGCATLPKDFQRPESYALTDTENTPLGKARAEEIAAHPGKSGFYLLDNGLDAFVARAVLSQHAERSIDAQYFHYHDDLIGKLFTDLLLKAADRGVRVRLLVDDMSLAGRDLGASALDSQPNVEVRIINPFSRDVGRTSQLLTRFGSVTRRMHNKSFTVDNQVTILGGRNIGSEYFEASPDLAFSDLDVMAVGPVVKEVSTVFDDYWNSELTYPASVLKEGDLPKSDEVQAMRRDLDAYVAARIDSEYLEALRNSDLAHEIREDRIAFRWGDAEIVFDRPEKLLHDFSKTEYHLAPKLKPHWERVEEELIIFSPYFVPGKEGTDFLTRLARRGVRVRILTNSLASNDVGLVHAGYMKYRNDLLRGGIELYELNKKMTRKERKEKKGKGGSAKASLHAKSFVFDRKRVFIGSLNLDPRSLVHNTEIGVVLNVPKIALEMSERFDKNIEAVAFRLELKKDEDGHEHLLWHGWENGEPVVYTHEPHTGFWKRFGIGFMSIWPIESQL